MLALTLFAPAGAAWAACDPAAGNNVVATCTGTTTDQGGGAPGTSTGAHGYGTGAQNNLNVAVEPGATVTGTGGVSSGISFNSGTVLNSGAISGVQRGILAITNATVTNSGVISGAGFGIHSLGSATVVNSGTISGPGGFGISANTIADVINSGTISAVGGNAINTTTANVTNSGIISGNQGIAATVVNLTNSGTISGVTQGVNADRGTVINSGTIAGSNFAISLSGGSADTLTLLPGSTIIGPIRLGGGGDTVNVYAANQNLTVDTLAGATVTSNLPFAVSGNRIATVDLTPFAAAGPLLTDFSRGVSSAVPDFGGQSATFGGIGSTAFAAPEPASAVAEAFENTGVSAYASSDRMVFKSPTVATSDGSAVWARGFAGYRVQQAGGVLLRNVNDYLGGAFGFDKQVRSDLRLGVFAGAGTTRSTLDQSYGGTDSDLAFGGVYARTRFGASYLNAAIQGGVSRNDGTRRINNNLAPGGFETARASYDGWYVSPEVTLGHHIALGRLLGARHTLTPSVQVRYLYASLGGYTETGSTANLTVGSRAVQNLEERAELKFTRIAILSPSSVLLIHLTGGALGVQRVGGDTINATLLGQPIPFATPGKADAWGGFGGLGGEFRNANVAVFGSVEYLTMSDNSSVVSGKGGVRVAF